MRAVGSCATFSALRNYWAGLMAADGMKILGGHYNDNGQLGIGGNAATGVLLDGLDGDPATLDGPELAATTSCTPVASTRPAVRSGMSVRHHP